MPSNITPAHVPYKKPTTTSKIFAALRRIGTKIRAKTRLLTISALVIVASISIAPSAYATVALPAQGGTGIGQSTGLIVGDCLKVTSITSQFVWSWGIGTCGSTGSGWATTTADYWFTTKIGGSNTQVQFNNNGALAGDSNFVWDKDNSILTIAGGGSNLQLNSFGLLGQSNISLGTADAGAEHSADVNIYTGSSNTLTGDILLQTGNVSAGQSIGNVILNAGNDGSRVGSTTVHDSLTGWGATLDVSNINGGDKEFAFPNQSGTFCLTTTCSSSGFSTSSASYFLSVNQGPAFSTSSASYFVSQNQGAAFSTTSADVWKVQRNFFSTTSAQYFLSVNQGPSFSTSSAQNFLAHAGLATTSPWNQGELAFVSGTTKNLVGSVGTSSIGVTGPITFSGTLGAQIGGGGGSFGCATCVLTTRNLNTTFPLQGGGSLASDLTITNAFGTTTNTGLTPNRGLYTGPTGIILTVATSSWYGPGTNGQVLMLSNGIPGWYSTSTALSGVTSVSGTWPIVSSGGTTPAISFSGLSTTSPWTQGQLAFVFGTNGNQVGSVATGTVSAGSTAITVTSGRSVIGGNLAIDCATASGSQAGCLGATDFATFSGKQNALTFTTPLILNGTTVTFSGFATTTQPASSNVLVSNGGAGVYGISTSSETCTSPLSCTPFNHIGAGGAISLGTIDIANTNLAATYPIILSGHTLSFPATSTLYGTCIAGQVIGWSANTGTLICMSTSTPAGTGVTSVTGIFPIASTGGNTPSISSFFSTTSDTGMTRSQLVAIGANGKFITYATSSTGFYANGGTNGNVLGITNGVVGWVATTSVAAGSASSTLLQTDNNTFSGATTTFAKDVWIGKTSNIPNLIVGTSTPEYGRLAGDLIDARYSGNTPALIAAFNPNGGTCAGSGFLSAGNILALNSDYAFFGFTNGGWTGSGCAVGNGTERPESTIISQPTGDMNFELASTSAAVAYKWYTKNTTLSMSLNNGTGVLQQNGGLVVNAASSTITGQLHIAQASTTNLEMTLYANEFAGADIGAKINAAYAKLPTNGGIIVVPAGTSTFSTQISFNTVNKRALLECAPGSATQLVYTGTATSTIIDWGGGGVGNSDHDFGAGIHDCTFVGADAGFGSDVGIQMGGVNGAEGVQLSGVRVKNFYKGLVIGNNTWLTHVENSAFNASQKNFRWEGSTNAGESIGFVDTVFADSDNTATSSFSSGCVDLSRGGVADFNMTGGALDDCQIDIGNSSSVHLIGVHYENPESDGVGNTYIPVWIEPSQYTNVAIIGGDWTQDATANRPPSFVYNGGTLVVSGLTARDGGNPPTTLFMQTDTSQSAGSATITGLLNAGGSAFTHIGANDPTGFDPTATNNMLTKSYIVTLGSYPFIESTTFSNITTFYNDNSAAFVFGPSGAAIGTSTPAIAGLTIGTSTKPQLALSDNNAGDPLWTFRNNGGTLFMATSTATATSTSHAMSVTKEGYFDFYAPYNPLSGSIFRIHSLDNSQFEFARDGFMLLRIKAQDNKDRITFHTIAGTNDDPLLFDSDESGTTRFTITGTGNVSVGATTTVPTTNTMFTVSKPTSNATTTIFLDSGSAKGTCLVMRDADGSGYTYLTVNNGVISASVNSCY